MSTHTKSHGITCHHAQSMADDTGGRHNGIAARRPAGAQHSQESLDRSNRDRTSSNLSTTETDDEEDGEEEEGEDTEPSLKYSKLTASLSQLYRGKDSTSASLISGDKMVCSEKLCTRHEER